MESIQSPSSSQSEERTNFQSIEEFMREQDELDAMRLTTREAPTPSSTPPSRKARKAIDIEALSLEANALEEIGETNWIGKLLEYRNVSPPTDGLKYIDSVIGPAPSRFICTAILAESPGPFGEAVSFTKKKDAKQYASKKAIDWLIDNNLMLPGGAKPPKPKAINPPVAKVKEGIPLHPATTPKSASVAGQIPELCIRLGLAIPRYEIKRVSESAPLYSGHAHFNGDPRIEGRIGEVAAIYGQKNAKEMIAEGVLEFLKDIERQRTAIVEQANGKGKPSAVSLDVGEISATEVKVQA